MADRPGTCPDEVMADATPHGHAPEVKAEPELVNAQIQLRRLRALERTTSACSTMLLKQSLDGCLDFQ